MGKKAVCISCFHYYENRIALVEEYLKENGYDVTYITSDFDHVRKEQYRIDLENAIQIHVRQYQKNLSHNRILSHVFFAKEAMKAVMKIQPDLLYVMLPPNSVCREAARYKKENPNVKLVLDIYDLWPETFPSGRAKVLLKIPFGIWGWLRNGSLKAADLIFTECDLYRKVLGKYLEGKKTEVLYLCRPEATVDAPRLLQESHEMHLCYLGSINNIIDIPLIADLLGQIQKLRPVVLHIIGDGESRETLICQVEETGAQVEFHGKIFDPEKRQEIFNRCSFGLNVMKESVCVGLTMKSLDYFAGGLPILNTIQGDTWDLVEKEGIGINIDRENLAYIAQKVEKQTCQENYMQRKNILNTFYRFFDQRVFLDKIQDML